MPIVVERLIATTPISRRHLLAIIADEESNEVRRHRRSLRGWSKGRQRGEEVSSEAPRTSSSIARIREHLAELVGVVKRCTDRVPSLDEACEFRTEASDLVGDTMFELSELESELHRDRDEGAPPGSVRDRFFQAHQAVREGIDEVRRDADRFFFFVDHHYIKPLAAKPPTAETIPMIQQMTRVNDHYVSVLKSLEKLRETGAEHLFMNGFLKK